MTVSIKEDAFVVSPGQTVNLGTAIQVTQDGNNPAYLVLNGLDRNEYTAASTGATGSLNGNGKSDGFTAESGDHREVGIVFSYQASTGRYYNATFGYLDQITYRASTNIGDVTTLSLFGTNSSSVANYDALYNYGLVSYDSQGYLGSATVVTASAAMTVPTQATPSSVAAAALSFVGAAWNMDGCWVLANTIATKSGASLPIQSNYLYVSGQANGEWIVAYNGSTASGQNWQSLVKTGEMIAFVTASGSGHITTCVSGSGATAMLVDNITYIGNSGKIINSANDGSGSDVIISAPHAASQEFAGVSSYSVVIYELDTPIVASVLAAPAVTINANSSLAHLVTVSDPASKAIVDYQIYLASGPDYLSSNGVTLSGHSAGSAATLASLSGVSLVTGAATGTDVLEIRAENAAGYWGDWQSVTVAVDTTLPPLVAPVIAIRTPAQSWSQGHYIALTLPSGAFTDPQGEALTYTASLAGGKALPSWLSFNAATETFSGIVPETGPQALSLLVTATDGSGLSTAETIAVTIPESAPILSKGISLPLTQVGQTISYTLPAGAFVDPQGEAITYSASLGNGTALPGWLTFNAATQTLSGTAPTPGYLLIDIKATNQDGLSTTDAVYLDVMAATPVLTSQTPAQTWVDGSAVSLTLPGTLFKDPQGEALTYYVVQTGGPSAASWLHFNASTLQFSGTVPTNQTAPIALTVEAQNTSGVYGWESFYISFSNNGHVAVTGSAGTAPFYGDFWLHS